MTKTNKTTNTDLCDDDLADLVASTIEDFLSQILGGRETNALLELAAASISTLVWMDREDKDLDELFEFCKEATLRNLKHTVDRWQSKVFAED
jgi:hypothetical protein